MGAAVAAAIVAGGAITAQAAPISNSGIGTVILATGVWAPFLGTAVNANATFDLDESNAYDKEFIAPAGEDPFWRWTFNSSPAFNPYGVMFTAPFASLTTGTPWLETLDNFDLDAAGNPFGATGIVDVLTIAGGNVVVDCQPPAMVDPVTGCDDPDAPVIGGTEFLWNFAAGPGWFSGNDVLPSSLMPAGGFVGVFGEVELIRNGAVVGYVEIDFNQTAPVPAPATLGLFAIGLAGLGLAVRRRRRD